MAFNFLSSPSSMGYDDSSDTLQRNMMRNYDPRMGVRDFDPLRQYDPGYAQPRLPSNALAYLGYKNVQPQDMSISKFGQAQAMHALGHDPGEIWKTTGWYLHPDDQRWRFGEGAGGGFVSPGSFDR